MTTEEAKKFPYLQIAVSDDEKRVLISWASRVPFVVVDESGAVTEQNRFEGDCVFESGMPGWDAGYDSGYALGFDEGYEQGGRDAVSPTVVAS